MRVGQPVHLQSRQVSSLYRLHSTLRQTATFCALVGTAIAASCPAHAQVTTFDAEGNVYIGTSPQSSGETITPGAFQSTFAVATCSSSDPDGSPNFLPCSHGYVSKVTPDGSKILVGTYLGGSSGDSISAIAVDAAGNIYVAGGTASNDFPITPDAYQKTPGPNFVSVLSPDGTRLLHSTYLNFAFSNSISAMAIDPQGRVLVVGAVTAIDFPSSFPAGASGVHPFLAALSPQLSEIDYAVAIDPIGQGAVNALALDNVSNVYVTGVVSKMFLTKLNNSGSKLWSFTWGDSSSDAPYLLSVDAAGEAYITGLTVSPDFPVTPGAFRAASTEPLAPFIQAFASKVSADGSGLVYSALLPDMGGPWASVVDDAGHLTIVASFSGGFATFPSSPNSSQPCLNADQFQSEAGVFFELAADGSHPSYATVLPSSPITAGMTSWLVGLEPNSHVLVGSQTKQFLD